MSQTDSTPRPAWRRILFPDRHATGWWPKVRWLALRLAVCYVVLVAMIAFIQRKLIYHPRRCERMPASEAKMPPGTVRDVAVTTHDGLKLHGWHFLPSTAATHSRSLNDRTLADAEWVVLYFHGNAGNRVNRRWLCQGFTSNGADVLLFDYRGYAENPGKPTEENLIADAKVMWHYAVDECKVPPSRIVLYGESIGGGVAVPLAAYACENGSPPGGLFLWGTFSSLVEAGSYHFPWLPVRWLLRDRYVSINHASNVMCPVMQLHGNPDTIVPMRFGRELFDAFPAKAGGIEKRWIQLPDVDHNDLSTGLLQLHFGRFVKTLRRGN